MHPLWFSGRTAAEAKKSVCRRTEVFRWSGVACQSCGRPKLARCLSKPFGFLLQREANDVNGALQVQQGGIQDKVVQLRIVRVVMVLLLKVAGSLMIFPVDTRLSCVVIDSFALHHIDHTFFKGGNDTDVQDIPQVGQDHLRGSSDDHHMASCGGGTDNPVHCTTIILGRKKCFWWSTYHGSWIEVLHDVEYLRDDPSGRLIMRLGLLLTRPELACHAFHNGVVDQLPSQAPDQTGGNLPPATAIFA